MNGVVGKGALGKGSNEGLDATAKKMNGSAKKSASYQ
jgi:hypothetical protein